MQWEIHLERLCEERVTPAALCDGEEESGQGTKGADELEIKGQHPEDIEIVQRSCPEGGVWFGVEDQKVDALEWRGYPGETCLCGRQ